MRLRLTALLMTLALLSRPLLAWQADQGDGTYRNPVLFADYSDPDVVRVNDDFYMVSSSFHYMPGIPILKSHDLVNWKIIGHAYDRLNLNPAYDLTNGNQYGNGCWAPSIRYHDGRFYIYFVTPGEGIYMVSASSAEGPWDPPVCVVAASRLEDPCPLWDDDGHAYLVHSKRGAGPLILHRMSPDGRKVLDDGKIIAQDRKNLPTMEGPKFYKRHGYYYIFAPVGGVSGGTQAVLRSKNIDGPYDYKIVLARGSTAINGPHQGGYVETPSGQGWFLHFQSRGAYGRIIHLEPVAWEDDWPVMGEKDPAAPPPRNAAPPDADAIIGQAVPGPVGQPVSSHAKPDVAPGPVCIPRTSDEFDAAALGLQWQWNHNPAADHWSLTKRPGFLRLEAMPAADLLHARNTLTQMLADPSLEATTLLDARNVAEGQRAGLCILSQDPSWIGVARVGGKLHLASYASHAEVIGVELPQETVYLRMEVAANQTASFSYSVDGHAFNPVGAPAKLIFSWWKGSRPGLFSYGAPAADGKTGAADFDWFHYRPMP